MNISTNTYRIGCGDYIKIIMSQWLNRWWWTIALPIAVQLLLGFVQDIVFLYTAFISIFLILPPVFLLIYYYYALTFEARIAIQHKHLEFQKDGINIVFENIVDETLAAKPIFLKSKDISEVKYTEKYILLMLQKERYSNITIPYSAIVDENQFNAIDALIKSYISHKQHSQ